MEVTKTERGFGIIEFVDMYGKPCSLQKSSLATEDAVWLGVNDANPKIMARDAHKYGIKTKERTGWISYPVPDDVSMTTRMHLTQDQVRELLPLLQRFVETGELQD